MNVTYTHSDRQHFNLKGFTLIELMVTIAILAILMAVAIPSFQGMIASTRLTSAKNDLLSSFARSRSEATKLGNRVTVCMSADGATCATTGGWEQGWITFIDATRSGSNASVDTGEVITAISPALSAGIVVNGNLPYVSYSSDGQTKTMTGGFLTGTMRVCSTSASLTNDKRASNLTLNSVGRITSKTQSNIAATCPSP